MKLVVFGFAIVAAAPASTTNNSEYTTMIRVGSSRHFQFPFSLKAMFISASSIGDSREQKYYGFSYSCREAQKELSAEENSIAKIPL